MNAQAGQDVFALEIFSTLEKKPGYYLEIGAGDPNVGNSTLLLERLGWNGLSVDISANGWHASGRDTSRFTQTDASLFDYSRLPPVVDFLSFDVDDDSEKCLAAIPFGALIFNCMTVEHDQYRRGSAIKESQRALLDGHGYKIICGDVRHDGRVFEDWYVHFSNPVGQSLLQEQRPGIHGLEWQDAIRWVVGYVREVNGRNPALRA